MPKTYDAIVLGLGGMGSAAAYHLAGRGLKVLGLEQFTPAHDKGSSHGKTRVIRQSYFEDPAYVPLLLRAYELWRQLEAESGEGLLFEVGGLMIGAENSSVVSGSLHSARTHGLPHEMLDAREVTRRFPVLTPPADHIALYEKKAGYVMPEKCVQAHLDQAARRGAELHFEEKVLGWKAAAGGDGVTVTTAKDAYEADRLVIAPGAWAPPVLTDAGLPLEVERQVLYWFDSAIGSAPFGPGQFPIYIWDAAPGVMPYGFPAIDGPAGGVKVALFRSPEISVCSPETIDRAIHKTEVEFMQKTIVPLIPALSGKCVHAVTCMYTNTPDHNFVLAQHPKHSQVTIGCGFSGHGFKFASVIGEVLADLAVKGATSFDIDFLRPSRFGK
jgi:sarcosine oxidase